MATSRLLCTFRIDALSFGVDAGAVQEVVHTHPLTPVPLAHPSVRGLMNLRGQIVMAIDLRRRLHLRERPAGEPPMTIIVLTDDGPAGLLVDEVGEALAVEEDAFEPALHGEGPGGELVRGAYKLADRLLLEIDVAATVRIATEMEDHVDHPPAHPGAVPGPVSAAGEEETHASHGRG